MRLGLIMGLGLGLGLGTPLIAQTPAQPERPRVFLDCERCDFDFLRRSLSFVDWVRDRDDGQVHVLVTTQQTGAGGTEYTMFFIGRGEFTGKQDTLRFATRQDDTDDERRSQLARRLAVGLVPFAAKTPAGDALRVVFDAPDPQAVARMQEDDPWDFWVFRTRLGGGFEGESSESSIAVDGSLSADRITEGHKFEFSAFGRYSQRTFEFEDDDSTFSFISVSRNFNINTLSVWSLSPHWSLGAELRTSGSTRVNQDIQVGVNVALEYSIYPYDESSRRQITALYTIGPAYFNYEVETAFEVFDETRVEQNLEISAGFEQPWGEIDASLEWSNYMHDFGLHRIELDGGVEVRLFRGFSLDFGGGVARIKNQIYIPLEDIPLEDRLLGRRRLGTDFEYDVRLGFSFTFGSVFNNVVNPRVRRGFGRFF